MKSFLSVPSLISSRICFTTLKSPSQSSCRNIYTSISSSCSRSGIESVHDRPSCNFSSSSYSSLDFGTDSHYSFFESKSFRNWFKDWNEDRRNKLTASTFAGAIGFWPRRRAQLWLEKLGAIRPFSGNLATCWSNSKEVEALERYKLITGNRVLFPKFQVYSKNDSRDDYWLGASPDGLIDDTTYELPSRGVLEIKCPFFNGDMNRASPWSRVPLYCVPQAQGLMEIMDRDWMDLYVWTPKGSSLFRMERDVEYWEVLKMALSDFWWNHVTPARELCGKYNITNPLIQLKSLRPSPRHDLCSYIVWKSKRVVDNSELLVRELYGKIQT